MRGQPAPQAPDDTQVAALVGIGVSEAVARERVAAQIDPKDGTPADPAYRVMPCNWQAVCLFTELPLAAWDMPPLGGKVRGLRRDQVVNELILRGVKRPAWPELWEKLRVMEQVVLGYP